MFLNGWQGAAIDVVKMPDGKLTSIDNTRVAAARSAGIDAMANVHGYNDPLTPDQMSRFATKRGIPLTWGEAIELRIGKQNATFRKDFTFGSFDLPTLRQSKGDGNMLNGLQKIEHSFQGFTYPKAFLKAVELNLVDLYIWYIMDDKQALLRYDGLQKRYPQRKLIPFARREDSDDVACFEMGRDGRVYIIHDYANDGWEKRKEFSDVWDWFESAVKDMVIYEREEERNGH